MSDGAGGEVLAGGTRCQKFTKGKVCVTAQSDGRPLWVRPPGSSEIVSVYAVGAQSKRGFAYSCFIAGRLYACRSEDHDLGCEEGRNLRVKTFLVARSKSMHCIFI